MEAEFHNGTPQGLAIDLRSEDFLRSTAKWGKFLAIMGFIMIALMVVFSFFAGSLMGSAMSGMGNDGAGFMGSGFFIVFYLLFAIIYFFPVLYLYKFSVKMQDGLRVQNQDLVTESFKNLKSLFKFMGILTVIVLAFYVLGMLAVLIGFGAGALFS